MGKIYKNIKELEECPYCGNKEYYTIETAKGVVMYNHSFEEEFEDEVDNSTMYDGLTYKLKSKFAFCRSCHKRVGLVE